MFRKNEFLKFGKGQRLVEAYSLKQRSDPGDSVLYCTDGVLTEYFATSFFKAHPVPDLWFIGVDADPKWRNAEYVPGRDAQRFEQHEAFFTRAPMEWAEANFGLVSNPERTGIFGFSSGGSFAVKMAMRYPGRFRAIYAFSIAGRPVIDFQTRPDDALGEVAFFFRSGSEEFGGMKSYTNRLEKWLAAAGSNVDNAVLPGDHDLDFWIHALDGALTATGGLPI